MPGSHPSQSTLKTTVESSLGDADSTDSALSPSFTIHFWGVRGSVPTPGRDTVRYGGNTVCVELRVGETRLIFDGGTGLCAFGKQLLDHMPTEAHLFFTHTQADRIQGFPFFKPAFVAGNRFHIYGAPDINGASIKHCLTTQMLRPRYPRHIQDMKSELKFCDLLPGHSVSIQDIRVEALPVNHISSSLGYRVSWQGKSVVYATDTGSGNGVNGTAEMINQGLIDLASGADVLICDGTHHGGHPGIGHHKYLQIQDTGEGPKDDPPEPPVWKSGLDVALKAGVKQLVMAYHDPDYDDNSLDQIEAEMRAKFPNTILAREGLTLDV